MKKYLFRVILSAAKNLALMGLVVGFFACGDDSGSTSASAENGSSHMSSSTPIEDLDESSSSVNGDSSSSITPGSSSSVILSDSEGSSSSSSVKADGKSSSSSKREDISSSSSSEFVFKLCEDGDTSLNVIAGKIYYNSCKNGQWNFDSIGNYVDVKPKVYPNMDSVFGTLATFETYTDQRDDKTYKTVKYRSAVSNDSFTVLAQNLNYAEIMIDSTTTEFDDSKVEKRCYKDDPWYCDNYFGARYTWSEAMGLPKVCDSVGVEENPKCNIDLSKKVQGVCPTGWHVMTETEWKHMATSNGYSAVWSVLSKAVWNYELVSEVQNSRGLSVLPEGDEYPYNKGASFWIPYEKSESNGGVVDLAIDYFTVSSARKYSFMNVRCVQDEGDTFLR